MGRELESRLEKLGIHKMSLKDMLRVAIKDGDTYAVERIERLIRNEAERQSPRRRSTAKTIVAEAKTTTVAKSTCKARSRSAVK